MSNYNERIPSYLMTLQKIHANKLIIGYGLLLGFIYVLVEAIKYITNAQSGINQWGTSLFYLLFPAILFIAIGQFKKHNEGLLKLSEALKIGLKIAVISGLIAGIYMLIYRYLIDPSSVDQLLEETRLKLSQDPNVSKEMLDKMMIGVKMGVQPWFTAIVWVFLSALFGLIYSLIAGLIMKKRSLEQ